MRANVGQYRRLLAGIPGIETLDELAHVRYVYQVFKIMADDRDALQGHLSEHVIGIAVHYATPIHHQTVGVDLSYKIGDFPVTEQ